MTEINDLISKIEEANLAYRTGTAVITDQEYDSLVESLYDIDPDNEFFNKVGVEVLDESRKVKLPIPMFSMNKIKSMGEIFDWCKSKTIPHNTEIIITPKFDGLSFCVNELTGEAITRGDGINGQRSNSHYKSINNKLSSNPSKLKFTYGEVIMSKKNFTEKYADEFANPRNLVAGLVNSKTVTNPLADVDYIKYGVVTDSKFKTKQEILDLLNGSQEIKVQYHISSIKDLTEDLMIDLFKKWSIDYEIDGVILEINDISFQEKLGRETSSKNPCFARAFKHGSFEQTAETEILDISWNISKQGLLKPVALVSPIKLDGVQVSRCTLNNAKFVKDMGLGKGARVIIKRSGMVIPLVVSVTKSVEFEMPQFDNIEWNSAGIELVSTVETDEQKKKKLVSFFEILEADNVSEGIVNQLWNAGFQDLKTILNLKTSDLEKIEGFGKRKSSIVHSSIQGCIKDVSLSKVQHALGIFSGLGSKKLLLLEHFTSKPTVDQVIEIEGFAQKSAQTYIDNYDRFFEIVKELPITLESKKEIVKSENSSQEYSGRIYVFTGIRDKEAHSMIEEMGGKVGSSVSGKTTHLVVKEFGSGSSKESKAMEMGIEIVSIDDLRKELGI